MAPPPSWVDSLIVAYLLAHGVIALLVDVQSIVPDIAPSLLPLYEAAGLRAIVRSWANVHGDFLVATNPLWFKSFIGCEVRARARRPGLGRWAESATHCYRAAVVRSSSARMRCAPREMSRHHSRAARAGAPTG